MGEALAEPAFGLGRGNGAIQAIETQQSGPQDRRSGQPPELGGWRDGVDAASDALEEGRIVGSKHSSGQHHVGVETLHPKAADRRSAPGDHLIGESIDDGAGHGVARSPPPRPAARSPGVFANGIRSRYIATLSDLGRATPKWAGTVRSSNVAGPRPSWARTAAASPASPRLPPPPQSPEISPRASNRATRPSGETPRQFIPLPLMTQIPQVRLVPARRPP